MMTVYDAARAVKKAVPERTPTYGCDYDERIFVITSLLDPNKPEKADPFYAVDKKTGFVEPFTPASDLAKFGEAMGRGTKISL